MIALYLIRNASRAGYVALKVDESFWLVRRLLSHGIPLALRVLSRHLNVWFGDHSYSPRAHNYKLNSADHAAYYC